MSRLPNVSGDNNNWGTILNDFLGQSHNSDGTLRGDAVNAANYGSSFINVKTKGATGDGSTDDTAAIQAALNLIPSTGGVLYFPVGTYKISGTITYNGTGPCVIRGEGMEASGGQTKIKASSTGTYTALGTTGYTLVLDFSNTSNINHFRFENFYVDMTGLTNTIGLYCDNVGYSMFRSLKFREGAIGFAGLRIAGCIMDDLHAWNQASYGFAQLYTDGTNNVTTNGQANSWRDCEYRMTSAVNNTTAGFAVLSGQQDVNFTNCHSQRTVGISTGVQYGFLFQGQTSSWPPTSGWSGECHLTQCNADGVVNSAQNGAGIAFINYRHPRLHQSWVSAMDTTNTWYQPAILIQNCQDILISGNEISSNGISLAQNVDLCQIVENGFSNAGTITTCVTTGTATVTNLVFNDNTKKVSSALWFDNQSVAGAALNSATSSDKSVAGILTMPNWWQIGAPSGSKGQSVPRQFAHIGNQAWLSTGRLSVIGVPLLGDQTVSAVTFVSNATAAATPTHSWAVLLDASLNVVRQSTDQLTAAWAANTATSFTLDSVPTTAGSRSGGTTVTLTLPTLHDSLTTLFTVGDSITVSNAGISAYNGTFTITGVTSSTITYTAGSSATDSLSAPFPTIQLASTKRSFTPPQPALYYFGLMVAASTVPTISGATTSTAVTGISPILIGSSSTGLTGTCPSPAGALSSLGAAAYCYWS